LAAALERIAEADDLVDRVMVEVRDDGLERDRVAVDTRDQRRVDVRSVRRVRLRSPLWSSFR